MPKLAINTHEGKALPTEPRKLQAQVTAVIPVETEEERQRRIYESVRGAESMQQESQQNAPAKAPRQTIAESKSQQPRKANVGGGRKLSRKQLARKQKAAERGEAYCSQQEVVELDKNKLQALGKGGAASAPSDRDLDGNGALGMPGTTSIVHNVARTDKKKKRAARKHKAY